MVHIRKITNKDRNKKPRENEVRKIQHLQDLCGSPDYINEIAYNMTKLYRKTRQYQRIYNKEQYEPYRSVNEVDKKH